MKQPKIVCNEREAKKMAKNAGVWVHIVKARRKKENCILMHETAIYSFDGETLYVIVCGSPDEAAIMYAMGCENFGCKGSPTVVSTMREV